MKEMGEDEVEKLDFGDVRGKDSGLGLWLEMNNEQLRIP